MVERLGRRQILSLVSAGFLTEACSPRENLQEQLVRDYVSALIKGDANRAFSLVDPDLRNDAIFKELVADYLRYQGPSYEGLSNRLGSKD